MDARANLPLDAETKVAERPDDHKTELRLWLRMLTCTTLIEGEVRRRLREQFDVTLPRFDLLAQLDRAPDGMTLGELAQMINTEWNPTPCELSVVACKDIEGMRDRRKQATDRESQKSQSAPTPRPVTTSIRTPEVA